MTNLTYTTYLQIPDLLSLQHRASQPAEHDEMLFIIIHQVYELWFKQLLFEFDHLQAQLAANDQYGAMHTLLRSLKILKVMVAQFDILETMTPLDFSTFRSALTTASGFESYQFRELEFMLGEKHPKKMNHFPDGSLERTAVLARYHAPTLWDAFLHYLARQGVNIPADLLQRDITQPIAPHAGLQAVLLHVYRTDPFIKQLCELMVDFDEGLMEYRYRHIMMVQRTIGTRTGTGGSTGVEYLRTTLFKPAFPDLWAIRNQM